MVWELDNQLSALGGSLSLIILWILVFKNLKDRNGTKRTWRQYFGKNWDDFAGILFFGQVVTTLQDQLFTIYVHTRGSEDDWNWYIDIEELISYLIGIFGMLIFTLLYKLGKMGFQKLLDRFLKRI